VYTAATAVECDGFKFHNSTKESAAKDRARDRDIQAAGLPILRFSGCEIWADVFKCAAGVLRFLLDRSKAELKSHSAPRSHPVRRGRTVILQGKSQSATPERLTGIDA